MFSWNSPKFVSQTFSDIFHLTLSSFKQKLLVIGFKIVRKASVTSEMQDISNFSLSFLLKGKKCVSYEEELDVSQSLRWSFSDELQHF